MLALISSACSNSTGPDELALPGTWQGTTLLPGAFTTEMVLTQSGNTIGGTHFSAGRDNIGKVFEFLSRHSR
jgi:hypothetical protein